MCKCHEHSHYTSFSLNYFSKTGSQNQHSLGCMSVHVHFPLGKGPLMLFIVVRLWLILTDSSCWISNAKCCICNMHVTGNCVHVHQILHVTCKGKDSMSQACYIHVTCMQHACKTPLVNACYMRNARRIHTNVHVALCMFSPALYM